jgi:hypothetical protein
MVCKKLGFLLVIGSLIALPFKLISAQQSSAQDLMQACSTELSGGQAHGSCLRLGVLALKVKHLSLFDKIQEACIAQVKAGKINHPEYFEPLLSYYPKCNYIYRDKFKKSDLKFKFEDELKTLVRFLN